MFGIGTGELLLLLLVALVVLGPERMPRLARDVGRALAEFRKTSDELREEFLNADKLAERMTQATVPGASALPEAGSADSGSAGASLAETSAATPAAEQSTETSGPARGTRADPMSSIGPGAVPSAEEPTAALPGAKSIPARSLAEAASAMPAADAAAANAAAAIPATAADVARSPAPAAPEGPLVEPSLEAPSVAPDEAVTDHGETAFDREAREARERLQGHEHRARAEAEGWEKPTDAAGNSSEKWA